MTEILAPVIAAILFIGALVGGIAFVTEREVEQKVACVERIGLEACNVIINN